MRLREKAYQPHGTMDPRRQPGSNIGPARQLEPALSGRMESAFGHSFEGVRIHSDDAAARSAESIGAAAYTVGEDVVFADGEYAPDTPKGQFLLAHELAHVVQQSRFDTAGATDEPLTHTEPGDYAERDATDAAARVMLGRSASVSTSSPPVIARGLLDFFDDATSAVGSAFDTTAGLAKEGVGQLTGGAMTTLLGGLSSADQKFEQNQKAAAEKGQDTSLDALPGILGPIAQIASDAGSDEGIGWGTAGKIWDSARRKSSTLGAFVQGAVEANAGAIEGGTDWVANLARSGADSVKDVPILGSVADVGASVLKDQLGIAAGFGKGVVGIAGGMASAAVDPASFVENQIKETGEGPTMRAGGALLSGVSGMLSGEKGLGDVLSDTSGAYAEGWTHMAKSFGAGYIDDFNRGRYTDILGRGLADVGSIVLATSGGGGAARGARPPSSIPRGIPGEIPRGGVPPSVPPSSFPEVPSPPSFRPPPSTLRTPFAPPGVEPIPRGFPLPPAEVPSTRPFPPSEGPRTPVLPPFEPIEPGPSTIPGPPPELIPDTQRGVPTVPQPFEPGPITKPFPFFEQPPELIPNTERGVPTVPQPFEPGPVTKPFPFFEAPPDTIPNPPTRRGLGPSEVHEPLRAPSAPEPDVPNSGRKTSEGPSSADLAAESELNRFDQLRRQRLIERGEFRTREQIERFFEENPPFIPPAPDPFRIR